MPPRTRSRPGRASAMLLDETVPLPMRRHLLSSLLQTEGEESDAELTALFAAAARGDGENLHAAKARELAQLMDELRSGPLRPATFLQQVERQGLARRARVRLGDGQPAFALLPDDELAASLRPGDEVFLDAQGGVVLFRDEGSPPLGVEARLERTLDDNRVEVSLRDEDRQVMLVASALADELRAGTANAGDTLLVCTQRKLALARVPDADGLSHYRYLQRLPVPDVVAGRDMGCPPALIEELAEHVRRELEDPGLGRAYGLHRARTWMLTGLPGTGKTLTLLAVWRRLYELLAERHGVALEALPPRVMRLRVSEILSKWLGSSDRHIDRFFDEVEELAATRWTAPDGSEHELPVLVLGEEVDALARTRGDDGIHDRIQATLLERLDTTHSRLRDRLVLFLFTTNLAEHVDPAFLRRAGGQVTRFGPLDERGFRAVLERQLSRVPVATRAGVQQPEARAQLVHELCGWLFSERGNGPQAELHYAGSSAPEWRHRRHFLTGGLVDRAVQAAASEAAAAERAGHAARGIDLRCLADALRRQVRDIVERLSPRNASMHLLLDGSRTLLRVSALPDELLLPDDLTLDDHLFDGDPS